MIALKETTVWPDDDVSVNHTYLFEKKPDGRERSALCIAYIKRGQTDIIRLATPLKLDMRGRTFLQDKSFSG